MKKLYSFKGKIGDQTFDFGLKKPSRTEMEDIDIFYSAILSKLMSQGVQTKAAVDKYYADNVGGAMTKDDEKEVVKLRRDLIKKENELIEKSIKQEDKLKLYSEITELAEKIRTFNEYYAPIYDNTAEIKSRNKTIDFEFLNFSLIGDEPLFNSETDDPQKRMLEQFDIMEGKIEESEDWQLIFDKLIFLFTLWHMGVAETEKDFDDFIQEHFGKEIEDEIEKAQVDEEEKKESENKED